MSFPEPNYGGKIPPPNIYIKQFYDSYPLASGIWGIKNNSITPIMNPPLNVLIQKDLTVLGTIHNTSDETLKKNIVSLKESVIEGIDEKITKLTPVKFEFINDPTETKRYGLIAQEVERLFPELVSEIEINKQIKKTVNYIDLIPILLYKIQKMDKEIEELKRI